MQNSRSGKYDLPAALAERRREPRAQLAIGAHAAGDDEPRRSRRVERRDRLRHEHVDDRVLELARDVGAARVVERPSAASRRTSVSAAVLSR